MKTIKPYLLFLSLFSSFAFANDPSYLSDFDYSISSVDSFTAEQLFRSENSDVRTKSICANRAHIWSYDMKRKQNIDAGKVFIFFTNVANSSENVEWAYHVAPYVIVDGVEMVLDSGFPGTINGPITIDRWTQIFGRTTQKCKVLDPVNDPIDLALMDNTSPGLSPYNRSVNGARQFPSYPAPCYVRKAPGYYWMPAGVYGHDIYAANSRPDASAYSMYLLNNFNKDMLIQACKQGMQGSILFKGKACKKYFGFED